MTSGDEENDLPDLEQYRDYLKTLADRQLNPRLRVKEGASDIVQQTILDAHCDFENFRGTTEMDLRAWLKMILTRNLLTLAKRFETHKPAAAREVSLQCRRPNVPQYEANKAGTV